MTKDKIVLDNIKRNEYSGSFIPKSDEVIHQIHHVGNIPIIVCPGIMCSNLYDMNGKTIWYLNKDFNMVINNLLLVTKGASERKSVFTLKNTRSNNPYEKIFKNKSKQELDEHLKKHKGWDEVSEIVYDSFHQWLSSVTNDNANLSLFDDPIKGLNADHSKNDNKAIRWLLQTPSTGLDINNFIDGNETIISDAFLGSLTRDEVITSYDYDYPIYACGYNWLQDNKISAQTLGDRIDKVLELEQADKVIIITHSMGGIVERYCSQALGYESKIAGVINSVMPGTGAAAAYQRMKIGTEGMAAGMVTGKNGAEMSAIMGQSAGPLGLLPSADYGTMNAMVTPYKQWLVIKNKDGLEIPLPQEDPYEEIYLSDEWYGLFNNQLINPINAPVTTKEEFKDIIGTVKEFHLRIQNKCHSNSYSYFSASDERPAYGKVTWSAQYKEIKELRHIISPFKTQKGVREGVDNVGGVVKTHFDNEKSNPSSASDDFYNSGYSYNYYKMSEKDVQGDGTVPFFSSLAFKNDARIKALVKVDCEHGAAFTPETSRLFVLWSIVKIANFYYQHFDKYK